MGCVNQYSAQCQTPTFTVNLQATQAWMTSLTGQFCAQPLCLSNNSEFTLNALMAMINTELSSGLNGLPRLLMQSMSKDQICK